MLISELARKTGISRDTIRYYEKFGLIEKPPRTNKFNNYRVYSEESMKWLMFIKQLRALEFGLREIRIVLDTMKRNGCDCSKGIQILENKVVSVDTQIKGLKTVKTRLRKNISIFRKQAARLRLLS
jgi:DNA-binding transcriptional MerR regulator